MRDLPHAPNVETFSLAMPRSHSLQSIWRGNSSYLAPRIVVIPTFRRVFWGSGKSLVNSQALLCLAQFYHSFASSSCLQLFRFILTHDWHTKFRQAADSTL